jgi:MFS family permease
VRVTPDRQLARARVSVSLTFVMHAAVSGTWAPRIPALKDQAGIGNAQLGLALFGMAAGLLAGTRGAHVPVDRLGSRRVLRVGVPLMAATLALPALAHGLPALAAGLFVVGFASGLLDVAMNAHGVEVQRRLARPILNSLHGLWSVGLGLGAGGAALAATAHLTPIVHFAIVGVLIGLLSIPALCGLRPDRPARRLGAGDRPAAPRALWSLAVLVLGAIAFGSFVGEGSVSDWSAVYLREDVGTGSAVAATGFLAFSASMAASRFLGDRLAVAVGVVRLVRVSALTAAGGLGLGLVVNEPALAIVAFGVFGAGLAPVVPSAFSAAGQVDTPGSARGLGRVATFGYAGSVLGPLAMGGLSQLTSVRVALGLPVALALAIAVAAGHLSPPQARGPDLAQ